MGCSKKLFATEKRNFLLKIYNTRSIWKIWKNQIKEKSTNKYTKYAWKI